MRTLASPDLVYHAEMSLACTYSSRRKTRKLAAESAAIALNAAIVMRRPDLAYRANSLLAAIGGV